jgi:NAD(P)-dependent dehydrogenase (short-subunit alcohol dehydrogenase family)
MIDYGLTGRVVVITGAGSGIGWTTARAFLDHGAFVVGGDLDATPIEQLPPADHVIAVPVDLASADGPAHLVAEAISAFGRIDIVVNNVGIAPYRGGFLQVTDEEWRHVLDTNLMSMVRTSRAALPHMVASGGGAIITVASDMARQPDPVFVDYAVSKAAMLALSKAISREFGAHGITANCVSPGPTRTPAWDRPGGTIDGLVASSGLDREAAVKQFVTVDRKMALHHLGTPDDVAAVILFLASDLARQITGSEYAVNGGSVLSI